MIKNQIVQIKKVILYRLVLFLCFLYVPFLISAKFPTVESESENRKKIEKTEAEERKAIGKPAVPTFARIAVLLTYKIISDAVK